MRASNHPVACWAQRAVWDLYACRIGKGRGAQNERLYVINVKRREGASHLATLMDDELCVAFLFSVLFLFIFDAIILASACIVLHGLSYSSAYSKWNIWFHYGRPSLTGRSITVIIIRMASTYRDAGVRRLLLTPFSFPFYVFIAFSLFSMMMTKPISFSR